MSGPITEPAEEEETGGELETEVYLLEVHAEFDEFLKIVSKHMSRI